MIRDAVRHRELKPAIDLTTIEMPVQIVSIKVKGKELAPGEKTVGDDDWLKDVSFTIKNVSEKPIAYVAMGLRFEPPPGAASAVVFTLSYGVDYPRVQPRGGSSPQPIQPNQTVDLVLTDERYPHYLKRLSLDGTPAALNDSVRYYVERVVFEDDPNVIWEGGYLKRKNPSIDRFDIIERYQLPTKH